MSRGALTGTALCVVMAVTACGAEDEPSVARKTSAPTAAPSTAATEDIDPDDVAGIVAGTPTDVRWSVPKVPTSWKSLPVDAGERQWQVGTACVITLSQPAGLGSATEPTSDGVLDEFAKRVGAAVGQPLEVTDRNTSMLPLRTGKSNVTATTKVSHAKLSGGRTQLGGEIYAYRSGDFALVLSTVCGDGSFEATDASDFGPFIDQLAVEAEY